MNKTNQASIISLIFTLVSFLCTFTFIVPLIQIVPVASILEDVFGPASYEKIGTRSILFLSILTLLLLAAFFTTTYVNIRKGQENSVGGFIFFLLLLSFIIQPLGFFLYVSTNWSMANDGQFIFAVFQPFAITSFSYILVGLVTDLIRNLYPSNPENSNTKSDSEQQPMIQTKENLLDESMIQVYINHYKKKSNEELSELLKKEGIQPEAKIAAERTLEQRKTLPNSA